MESSVMDERNKGFEEKIAFNRGFTKCTFPKDWESDQKKGLAKPPMGKGAAGDIIRLEGGFDDLLAIENYRDILDARKSERRYDKDRGLAARQLAFMLWSAQGVKSTRGGHTSMRPVPSGGARHPFELYFSVGGGGVEGVGVGVYHYLPFENIGTKDVAIEFISPVENYEESVSGMLSGQNWAVKAPVAFFISCVAYRAEWRYSILAHRVLLIDLGHIGQNIMLSAAALGLGSCCLAAIDAGKCDSMLKLDGVEEYAVYAATVGYAQQSLAGAYGAMLTPIQTLSAPEP
ncbi:MAG: SagB/ThcOx family dehydrogenase [Chitinispirillales bacterium]|jgi:SagB-type dehydrogenase family enzyme|nr:SagB/ThcOx family dehydrogenase [Chitinispirillales bacterium]